MSGIDPLQEAREAGFGDTPWQGVFIQRGQLIDISSFTITEHDDGEITATSPTLSTSTHMAPFWLSAAVDHCVKAEKLSHRTDEAFRTNNPDKKSGALNDELISAMQAITCAAFAVDALYASILRVNPTPEATRIAWAKNRTKRSRQMFETFRRTFKTGPKSGARIKHFLDQLSDGRDKAVHPPAGSKPAQKHNRLPVSVDPAFNLFRAYNAIVSVGLTFDLIMSAARADTVKPVAVRERMQALLELSRPIEKRWKRTRAGRKFKELQRIALADEAEN